MRCIVKKPWLLLILAAALVSGAGQAFAGQPEPAKQIFGRQTKPSPLAAHAIGGYGRGCLAGGQKLRATGPAWEVMRLSRNRYWGHPVLVKYIEKLAAETRARDGWPGLLVGDMSQPMGGPMLTGHASHQIGLDVDLWLTPWPGKPLTMDDREKTSARNMVNADKRTVSSFWTDKQAKLIRRAALSPQVARIFVHPAIKKALCDAAGKERGWLTKVHAWYGHDHHFHVRLGCPAGSAGCVPQPAGPEGDGCGEELEKWFKLVTAPPGPPGKPKPPLTMADLPAECAKLVAKSPAPAASAVTPAAAETSLPMEGERR